VLRPATAARPANRVGATKKSISACEAAHVHTKTCACKHTKQGCQIFLAAAF
jgi:hypothetical protein